MSCPMRRFPFFTPASAVGTGAALRLAFPAAFCRPRFRSSSQVSAPNCSSNCSCQAFTCGGGMLQKPGGNQPKTNTQKTPKKTYYSQVACASSGDAFIRVLRFSKSIASSWLCFSEPKGRPKNRPGMTWGLKPTFFTIQLQLRRLTIPIRSPQNYKDCLILGFPIQVFSFLQRGT